MAFDQHEHPSPLGWLGSESAVQCLGMQSDTVSHELWVMAGSGTQIRLVLGRCTAGLASGRVGLGCLGAGCFRCIAAALVVLVDQLIAFISRDVFGE